MCQLAMNFWMGSSIYGLFYQHRIIALLRFPTDLETNQTNFRAQATIRKGSKNQSQRDRN